MNAEVKRTPAATGRAEVVATALQVAADGIRALDRLESELAQIAVQVAEARLKTNTARAALEQVGATASALQSKETAHG